MDRSPIARRSLVTATFLALALGAAHGGPAVAAQPAAAPSSPLTDPGPGRPAIAEDVPAQRGALPSGYVVRDMVVSNTDANLKNTDTFQDTEPSLAIDGASPTHLAGYTFSSSWTGGAN